MIPTNPFLSPPTYRVWSKIATMVKISCQSEKRFQRNRNNKMQTRTQARTYVRITSPRFSLGDRGPMTSHYPGR